MVRIDIIGLRLPKPFIKYDDGCDTKQVKIDLMNSFGMGMLKNGDKGVLTSTLDGDYQYEVNSTGQLLLFCIMLSTVLIFFFFRNIPVNRTEQWTEYCTCPLQPAARWIPHHNR